MTRTRRITADEIIALGPCSNWPHKLIRARIGRGKTPTEIATASDVSIGDRLWVLTGYAAHVDRKLLVLWAAGCAQDARDTIADEDARDAADVAIQTTVAWAEGCASEQDCREASNGAYAYSAAGAAYAANYAAYAAYLHRCKYSNPWEIHGTRSRLRPEMRRSSLKRSAIRCLLSSRETKSPTT